MSAIFTTVGAVSINISYNNLGPLIQVWQSSYCWGLLQPPAITTMNSVKSHLWWVFLTTFPGKFFGNWWQLCATHCDTPTDWWLLCTCRNMRFCQIPPPSTIIQPNWSISTTWSLESSLSLHLGTSNFSTHTL